MAAHYCPTIPTNCVYADILIKIENPTTKQVINSITTGKLPIEKNGLVWKQYNLLFSPQAGQNTVDLVFVNNGAGGNGNDLVLDDIAFKICLPNVTIASPAVCSGKNITINGTLNAGFVNPEMQWQVSSGGGPWTDIPGAKAKDLVINNVTLPPPVLKYRLLVAEDGNVKEPHCRVISNEYAVTVNENPTQSTVTSNDILCRGGVGSATATGQGGLSPYTYQWLTTPVQTTNTATDLAPGTYSVTVTDANTCSSTKTVTLTQPSFSLTATTWATNSGCNLPTGTASVAPAGGTPAYSYSWNSSPVQTTQTATGLLSGNYIVTTTDANGCTRAASVYVPVANGPSVTATVVNNPLCYGTNTGSASTASTTGGATPYTYLWTTTPAQTTANATGLYANIIYTAIVTDANNCSSSSTVKVTDPPLLTFSSISSTNVSCYLGSNGTSTVTPTGGTSPYSYVWSTSPAQTNPVAVGLSAATVYTVMVTDANKCTSSSTIMLSQPTAVTLSTSVSGFSCAGTSPDGIATATAGGGSPPYSYLWKPGNKTTPSISNLTEGTYSVTITDSKGCSTYETATIIPSTKPDAKFSAEPMISCDGVMMKFRDESSPSPISSWNWNFGNGQTSTDQHPSHAYAYEAGTYSVTLVVSSPPCYDTIKTNIKISDILSYASFERANIFTPNGDGENDCFAPALIGKGADTLIDCVDLKVFDRWGIKMFESSDQERCWNGNNEKNNKPAADGVYFYVSRLGKTTIKGYVTLVRNKSSATEEW